MLSDPLTIRTHTKQLLIATLQRSSNSDPPTHSFPASFVRLAPPGHVDLRCATRYRRSPQDSRSPPPHLRLRCDREGERVLFALCWECISSPARLTKRTGVRRGIAQLGRKGKLPGQQSSASSRGDGRRNCADLLRASGQHRIPEALRWRRGEIPRR